LELCTGGNGASDIPVIRRRLLSPLIALAAGEQTTFRTGERDTEWHFSGIALRKYKRSFCIFNRFSSAGYSMNRSLKKTRNVVWLKVLIVASLTGAACMTLDNANLNQSSATTPTPTPARPRITEESPGEAAGMVIRLDFHPFTNSTSVFVSLRSDGSASALHYDRSQLTVTAAFKGNVPKEGISGILNRYRDPAFQEALRISNFSGNGLAQGDQFYLLFASMGQAQEVFGFVLDTNPVTQLQIKEVLGLETQLSKVPVGDAYLVSNAIEKTRFDKLRKEGKLRFLSPDEFPADLQSKVLMAIGNSHEFYALNKREYEEFLRRSANASEFYVTANGTAHQLTLLTSAKR
jgi:hypothetical protein